MNNKKSLVITYHVKKCKRIGGFHRFILYLEYMGYDVDWVTTPVSITWIFKDNDKENLRNFMELRKGIECEENGVHVRHFAQPIWIPAKIAKKLGFSLGTHYWSSWRKLRRKLLSHYDVILVEGVGCQYIDDLQREYPEAKIIYRASDILETYLKSVDAVDIDLNMVKKANYTLCVDELQMSYYEKRLAGDGNLNILRNPICSKGDIEILENFVPIKRTKKRVVYVGVSFVDLDYIEYAAQNNMSVEFVIIGPFERKSYNNIIYIGSLSKEKYMDYIKNSDVGISPIKNDDLQKEEIIYGYTGKIINYMTYLLPVVTTRSSNYLNLPGFYNASTKEEFSEYVQQALNTTIEERIEYKQEYLKALNLFSEDFCRKKFEKYIKE